LKINSQAQSLVMANNKDLKPRQEAVKSENQNAEGSTKIEEIKKLIAEGGYKIDIDKTAQAMVNEFIR